jgi:outer membrane protein assembly factor BamA
MNRMVWLAGLVGILAGASPAQAQDSMDRFLGLPLAGVVLRVESRPETSAPLLALIDIKPGDRLSPEAFRRVAQRFDQVPRFEGVKVEVEEGPEGLVLVFNASPKHPVDTLRVLPSSTTGLAPADLERLIREDFNGIPALNRTVEVEEAVKRILKEEGYRSGDARADVKTTHNPDRSTLEVEVNAGPRTTIVSAVIRGKSPLDPTQTLARIGATPGAPYRERALATALAEIRDELRAKQYYTAIAQASQPEFTPDGAGVSLVITIDAGPIVEVKAIGELPGRFDDYILVKRLNSASRETLDDSVANIVDGWKSKG